MRLFVVLSVLGLAAAAKLPNSYIPPPNNALTAGGSNFLQAPVNQYLPPGHGGAGVRAQQSFNHAGQPTSFSQGTYSQGGQQYRPSGSASSGQQYHAQSSQQQYRPTGPPIPILRYENVNNGDGSYHFDYATGNGIMHQEQGHLNNPGTDHSEQVVQGQYSYPGDDGREYKVSYKADAGGFQPVGDHLPVSVQLPQEYYEAVARNEAVAAERGQSYHTQGGYGGQGGQGQYNQGGYSQGGNSQGGYSQGGYRQQGAGHGGAGHGGAGAYQQQGAYSAPQGSYSAQSSFSSSGPSGQYSAGGHTSSGGHQSGAFSAQSGYHY